MVEQSRLSEWVAENSTLSIIIIITLSLTFYISIQIAPSSIILIIGIIGIILNIITIKMSISKGRTIPFTFGIGPISRGPEKSISKQEKPKRFWMVILVKILFTLAFTTMIILYFIL